MFARAIEAVEAGETFSSALEMVSSVDSKREIIKPFSDIGDALKGNNSGFFFDVPTIGNNLFTWSDGNNDKRYKKTVGYIEKSLNRPDFPLSFHQESRMSAWKTSRLIGHLNMPGKLIIEKLEDFYERYRTSWL